MRVLVDIDGWQKVVDAPQHDGSFTITVEHTFHNFFRSSASGPNDSVRTFIVSRTPFVINGLPLYAWRY